MTNANFKFALRNKSPEGFLFQMIKSQRCNHLACKHAKYAVFTAYFRAAEVIT